MGSLFQALIPLLATQHSRARLRITRHRGVDSATMLYDHAPINDVFRRVGGNTVLGLMDCKGMERPLPSAPACFSPRRAEGLGTVRTVRSAQAGLRRRGGLGAGGKAGLAGKLAHQSVVAVGIDSRTGWNPEGQDAEQAGGEHHDRTHGVEHR
jgi:hypothetical protein